MSSDDAVVAGGGYLDVFSSSIDLHLCAVLPEFNGIRMAAIAPKLRISSRFFYTWRNPVVASGTGSAAACSSTTTKSVPSTCATFLHIPVECPAAKSEFFGARCTTSGTFIVPSGLAANVNTRRGHVLLPRSFPPFSGFVPARFCCSPSSSSTSSLCLPLPLYCSSTSPFSYRGRAQPVLEEQQRRNPKEQQKGPQPYQARTQNVQGHVLQQCENQQGRHQQHQQGQHQRRGVSSRAAALLSVSPLLFTEWDKTSDPKNELLFLAGNTLGYCTEKFFENEYGQSIFACVLGLVYLALLGYEGKVNGAVWRMKHVFGTSMKMVGHPRYAHALPQNPLLNSYQKCPSK